MSRSWVIRGPCVTAPLNGGMRVRVTQGEVTEPEVGAPHSEDGGGGCGHLWTLEKAGSGPAPVFRTSACGLGEQMAGLSHCLWQLVAAAPEIASGARVVEGLPDGGYVCPAAKRRGGAVIVLVAGTPADPVLTTLHPPPSRGLQERRAREPHI